MSQEDEVPPLKYVTYEKVDFERGEKEIDWNNEEIGVDFMLSLVGYKVTGVEKHILMNHIHQKFVKRTGLDVGTTQLWIKLNTMYDLENLESHQSLPPWDDEKIDFQLPKEILPNPPQKREILPPPPPKKKEEDTKGETPNKNTTPDASSKKRSTQPQKTPSSTRSKDHSSRSKESGSSRKDHSSSSRKDHSSSSRKRSMRTPSGSSKKKSRK